MSLWTELKHRNAIRLALFYLIAARVVVLICKNLSPMIDASDAVLAP